MQRQAIANRGYWEGGAATVKSRTFFIFFTKKSPFPDGKGDSVTVPGTY